MAELKIHHIQTLSYLLSRGARHNRIPITTSELGRGVSKSQQAASKHLTELEQAGMVERAKDGGATLVRVTEKGYAEMAGLAAVLQKGLGSPPHMDLRGELVSGMGEGAYYMGLEGYTAQFREKIGYVPFPGTLNVRLGRGCEQAAGRLRAADGIVIEGFADGKRTYGWVKCLGATLNGSIPCQVVVLERTHHDGSIIELVSERCIREEAGLGDGSEVTIRVAVGSALNAVD